MCLSEAKGMDITMYELIQISEHDYYIQSPAKIGLVKLNDTEVCLVDSGNDKDAGRKVRKLLDEHEWTLKAIYNTHSNADHIGAISICRDRQAVKFMRRELSVILPGIRFWSLPCCMAAIHAKI